MTSGQLLGLLRFTGILAASAAICPLTHAQALTSENTDAPVAFVEPAVSPVTTPTPPETRHAFWDKENKLLFAANAAMAGADFTVTRANLQGGGQELNPIVRVFGRSTPGLAMNFVGETAGVVGLSYFFHKTGHHRLERAVSLLNLTSSAGAVSFGLAHR